MALGRGLSSLISPAQKSKALPSARPEDSVKDGESVLRIALDDIGPNPLQPRRIFDDALLEDLAQSIKENGILQPIIVARSKNGGKQYQIIAGERRWRAAKLAKLKEIPCIVRELKADDENLELAILENVQREDLNPIELGLAYKELQDRYKIGQDEIAKKVGKSRQVIGNTMRLLTLPAEIQADIESGALSENHARSMLTLPTDEMKLKLWRQVKEQKLSARTTEVAARAFKKVPSRAAQNLDAVTKNAVIEIEKYLGTKVTIEPGKHASDGGKIIIKYFSSEDLETIVKKIARRGS